MDRNIFKRISIIAVGLVLLQSLPWLASAKHSVADTQADPERVSTNWIYANADETKEMVACKQPRPQVCTQDYRPVCALLQDGGFKTYSNGCNACSDPAVSGYREGACE